MNSLDTLLLEVADPAAARDFYARAFGPDLPLDVRATDAPTEGFRGFHVSLTMAQPADVDSLVASAVAAGATTIKPVTRSFWGYGGVLRAPDGAIWKVVSSSKRNKGPATREIESIVLLLGCADISATKQFYLDRGFAVARSFGRKYVEFEPGSGAVTLGLLPRKALAKDAGVPIEGGGSHRLVLVGGDTAATDPDGFAWEPARAQRTANPSHEPRMTVATTTSTRRDRREG
ncbi:glyoxalase [Nocardioides nitrophenolicus]|uniref:glyoxalase n=1 Tax=Nocardioides nitrophenolicus TaxID=60489 RepID=UPI00195A5918|nr:glyoxalase [Nocardioides nitrophenolicus]MBM7517675.1 putative lactoylglutathione lyase [Nocardioides nitrophenolicus]